MTNAQMAKKALASKGIFSTVVSIDPRKTKHGCAYGVSFRCSERERAVSVLREHGVPFGEIMGVFD